MNIDREKSGSGYPGISRRNFLAGSAAFLVTSCMGIQERDNGFTPAMDSLAKTTSIPSVLLPELKRCPLVGIKNVYSELMTYLSWASIVRMAGDRYSFYENPRVKAALKSALATGLDIYYSDNPQWPIPVSAIRQRIDDLVAFAGDGLKVIGLTNEADLKKEVGNKTDRVYWYGDFDTVANYILVAANYITGTHGLRVAIGGFAYTPELADLITCLKEPDFTKMPDYYYLSKAEREDIQKIRFNPDMFIYNFHGYNEAFEITNRINELKEVFRKSGINNPVFWGEEIGTIDPNKPNIPAMLDAALAGGAQKVLLHELSDEEKFGYLYQENGIWRANQHLKAIIEWSQKHL